MSDANKPVLLPEGTNYKGKLERASTEALTLQFTQATRLTDLTEDFGFFSPALVYLRSALSFDLVEQFRAEHNLDTPLFTLELAAPVFSGLRAPNGDSTWERVLFALPKPDFDKFVKYVGTVAAFNRYSRKFVRLRPSWVAIPDVLRSQVETSARVDVLFLHLDTNAGHSEAETLPVLRGPNHLVGITWHGRTFPETATFAKAVFDEVDKPYAEVDKINGVSSNESLLQIPDQRS